jgi:glycosyltransferase involved in cell wall biosynthesis
MRHLAQGLAQAPPPHPYLFFHHFRQRGAFFQPSQRLYTPPHHCLEGLSLGAELWPRCLDLWHSPDFIPPRWGARHYIITVHDLAFLRFPHIQTRASLRYYAGGIRRAVRQADLIIAVSAATRDDLSALLHVPESKIRVVWQGCEPRFQPLPPVEVEPVLARYGVKRGYWLSVGTLEPRKNLPLLAQAYQSLPSALKKPWLVVGAEGWLADETVTALRQAGAQWLKDVPLADLPALYNGALALLLPSLYEGFGLTALEALACGTPALLAERGALREVADCAALYADPDAPEAWREAMIRLAEDEALRQHLSAQGPKRAVLFRWENTVAQTRAVYAEILGVGI